MESTRLDATFLPLVRMASRVRGGIGIRRHIAGAVLALIGFAGLDSPASALTLLAPLDFTAPTQSMWGPGGSVLSFGAKDSYGVGPFTFSYDIGASSGSVSARVDGDLAVSYLPVIEDSWTARIGLGFRGAPGGGSLSSDLGAWARIRMLGFDVLDRGYGLNVDATFTPRLGQAIEANDSFAAASVGVDLLVASAGVELDVEQIDRFTPLAVTGQLAYTLRGSGVTSYAPFSIAADAGITVDVSLPECGLWDFDLVNIALDSRFSPAFDVNLVVYEEHVDGIRLCRRCLWGLCIKIPCGLSYDRNEQELASIEVYRGSAFALDFNELSLADGFTIRVVPEPSTMASLAIGLVVLARARRRAG